MAIRSYKLVVLDFEDKIIDRFSLPIVENPTGNGFRLKLSTLETDVEDIATKIVQQKQNRQFTVINNVNAYASANVLTNWIQKYSKLDYKLCLEYNDTNIIKYVEGKVVRLEKGEQDEFNCLNQQLTFQPLTPDFIKRENVIQITKSTGGKSYPYKYPYRYGSANVTNNTITNPYIYDVPIVITIHGAIVSPTIELLDENNEIYNIVSFPEISLTENETLVINSAQRKIYKIIGNSVEDYSMHVDATHEMFLRAKTGTSTIVINESLAGEGFYVRGSWRQYTL